MINCFCYTPPLKNTKESKNVKHLLLINVKNNLILPVQLKEYNLFSPHNEISIEQ